MSFIDNLYALKRDLDVVLESNNDDNTSDKIEELEERIEAIKKKETRGFISDDEADDELDEVNKKLKEIKKKLDENNE